MFFSSLTRRIEGRGADGFRVADRAVRLLEDGAGVVSLALGDPDFDTATEIVETAVTALRAGRTHYTPVPGNRDLRRAIAAAQRRVDNFPWEAENVVVFPGAQSALFSAMLCVAESGRSVVTFDPLYATYEAVIGASGARIVKVPVDLEFSSGAPPRIDFQTFRKMVPYDASAVLLNCPNNPGGYVFDDETLVSIAELCWERDIWLISDEVYRSLIYGGRHLPVTSMKGMAERAIIVNSLSKSHAMTGWRCGWAIGSLAVAAHLERLAQCSLFGSPPFIQDAAVEALVHSDRYTADFRKQFARRCEVLLGSLARSRALRARMPAGGMFTLVDISACGLPSDVFAERALDEAGVAVVPGTAFSELGQSYIRVSFAQSEEVLAEGGRRLADFADRLAVCTG